ncbi:MAG: hypothetical protein QM764_00045 [Chitinophagaceae bacterium]
MLHKIRRGLLFIMIVSCTAATTTKAQTSVKMTYTSSLYAGIEVGSKGVKLSIVDISKTAKTNSGFVIVKKIRQ